MKNGSHIPSEEYMHPKYFRFSYKPPGDTKRKVPGQVMLVPVPYISGDAGYWKIIYTYYVELCYSKHNVNTNHSCLSYTETAKLRDHL